jgi:hypothetical protein
MLTRRLVAQVQRKQPGIGKGIPGIDDRQRPVAFPPVEDGCAHVAERGNEDECECHMRPATSSASVGWLYAGVWYFTAG